MSIIKTIFALLVMLSLNFSQNINISGKVTDTGITALPDAIVKLEKFGLKDTTDTDGNFTLIGMVGIYNTKKKLQNNKLSARIGNGVLFLNILEKGTVEIITYTLHGKAISSIKKIIDIGAHSILQPYMGNGVYLYKIKAGNSELIIKSPLIGRISGSSALSAKDLTSTATVSREKRYAPINDVIAITKVGYLNYRVIVTNSDTSGIEIKMIVCVDTVRDVDGNLYQAVRIGNQVWTVENLRVTRYNDGSPIPHIIDSSGWSMLSTPAFCYYENATHPDTIKKWGALYNWYTVVPTNLKKMAPAGWHVPTDVEWDTLQNYLITNGYNWDGTTTGNKISKSMATKAYWQTDSTEGSIGCDLTKNNRSGFSAIPCGFRHRIGTFYYQSSNGCWWSATEGAATHAWRRNLYYVYDYFYRDAYPKGCGFSVRVVKD